MVSNHSGREDRSKDRQTDRGKEGRRKGKRERKRVNTYKAAPFSNLWV